MERESNLSRLTGNLIVLAWLLAAVILRDRIHAQHAPVEGQTSSVVASR